jgi:hypothetical protein
MPILRETPPPIREAKDCPRCRKPGPFTFHEETWTWKCPHCANSWRADIKSWSGR